ncbi:MAG: cobalamin biosynthesis protein CobD [Chloroflexi bacterium]|nr:cobalamin biosynthesis protein CobD [Chloroflexota bacterium]
MLTLAVFWDVALGEPKRLHPVSAMGHLVSFTEKRAPRAGKAAPLVYGVAMAVLIPAAFALAAYALVKSQAFIGTLAYILVGACLLKGSFAVSGLSRAATMVRRSLEGGRVEEAREGLKSLVSRDTSGLSPELIASAAVESVAENTTDAFVAPWLAFALFGLPGAVAYRAVNTLDSMIGYHQRYEYLGKAAARLDDLLNLVPSRLSALLLVLSTCGLGLAAAWRAWQTMWRDHGKTESPNAGWTMSAMAGTLGVRLRKVGHYELGDPIRPVEPRDIMVSVGILHSVAALSFLLALGILVLRYGVLR